MCSNYPEIKLEPALQREDGKIKHLSSYAHVVHTTAKQKISRRRKNENVYEKKKNKECTCKACKTIIFRRQIYKFVTFSLPSSSWLLKLPNNRELNSDDGNGNARKQWSDWLNEEKQSCCTCGTHFNSIFWRSLPNNKLENKHPPNCAYCANVLSSSRAIMLAKYTTTRLVSSPLY